MAAWQSDEYVKLWQNPFSSRVAGMRLPALLFARYIEQSFPESAHLNPLLLAQIRGARLPYIARVGPLLIVKAIGSCLLSGNRRQQLLLR